MIFKDSLLCNNAGIANVKEEGFRNWRAQVLVNLGAVVQGTQLALRHIRETAAAAGEPVRGAVVNTARGRAENISSLHERSQFLVKEYEFLVEKIIVP